ncbi:peptidyl-tRNA hydrolase, mitochondrial-like [Malus sylvestris]|uniref:peptidyl-tRNA hydrolase, mitochondrial-like n=1 Tax=Malus sylvestris TaxID=3752 RepID=UPI0021ACA9AE|nr:peptidyl-tRNA hydrolase, mitochondrial-like [Malus sylvestris]
MIDAFAGSQGIAMNTVQCKAILGQGFVGEVPVFLAKPQTYMNLRDRTPCCLFKLSLNLVLVFHDDMTLPCGVLGLYPMEVMYTTMGMINFFYFRVLSSYASM